MPSSLPEPLTKTMTPKMVAFVDHYVAYGGRHQGRAAIMAGYAKSSADVVACRLLRRPDVLALLRHVVETRIKADAVASADTLRELRDSPATPAAVRRQCANDLLDRAGMLVEKFATVRHEIVNGPASDTGTLIASIIASFRGSAPEWGLQVTVVDQAKLDRAIAFSGDAPASDDDVIEADFEEGDDSDPDSPTAQ